MIDVTDWYGVVEQMIEYAQEREVRYFTVQRWEPDEVEAAREVIQGRLGYCPEIRIVP